MNVKIDYKIISKIYESANSLIYRAIKTDKSPIILKILKENYPTKSELIRYQQEYEITKSLNSNRIIKAYNIQRHENSLAILIEDFGGSSLNHLMLENQFNLE